MFHFLYFVLFIDKTIQLPVGRLDNVEWKRLKSNMDGARSSFVWDVVGDDLYRVMCGNHHVFTCVSDSGGDCDDSRWVDDVQYDNKVYLLHRRLENCDLDLRLFCIPRWMSRAIFDEFSELASRDICKEMRRDAFSWERQGRQCFESHQAAFAFRALSFPLVFLHNYCHWKLGQSTTSVCGINPVFEAVDPKKFMLNDFFNQRSVIGDQKF